MNGIKSILNLFAVIALCVICTSVAQAQATRTWVSGVGDDANPCSRTAPCKTFAGAISKTATNGEINVLDPGGFGAVSIVNKNISIRSEGNIAGVLVSGSNAITVNGAGAVVNLVGLDITGLANGAIGVRIIAAGKVNIQNCEIYGFATGVDVNVAATTQVNIRNTSIHDNSSNGINAIGATGSAPVVVVTGSNISGNGTGIRGDSNSRVSVTDTVISNNTSKGVDANATTAGQAAEVNLEHCEIVNHLANASSRGLSSGGTTTANIIRIANCSIHTNSVGFFVAASNSIITFQNNNIDGNGSNSGSLSPLLPQ